MQLSLRRPTSVCLAHGATAGGMVNPLALHAEAYAKASRRSSVLENDAKGSCVGVVRRIHFLRVFAFVRMREYFATNIRRRPKENAWSKHRRLKLLSHGGSVLVRMLLF